VSVTFDGVVALDEVSLSIECGRYVAIIGPNGAGKSTLLNVVLGLQEPTRGRVRVMGEAPGRLPRGTIGYIPQHRTPDRTFPGRARELVAAGLMGGWPWRIGTAQRDTVHEAMARTGVADLGDRPLWGLSGGELQRVYLARSLVRRPKLLVLDEPEAGLDLAGEAAMHHLLVDYQRETQATVLMITHDWEGARVHADDAVLMTDGKATLGPVNKLADAENLLYVFGHSGHLAGTHDCDELG